MGEVMDMVKFLVESENGHDTIDVPKEEIKQEVEKQLEDNKLVTLEKADGETEILTEADTKNEDFDRKFEGIKSATVTNKVKGG
jgi:hypothetical protein